MIMNIHSDETYCHGHDTTNGSREVMWTGRCACGWTGTDREADDAKTARRDYRDHVEEALGPNAYYDAPVACKNCGSKHTQGILVGTSVHSGTCCRCSTTMLSPNNEAWDDAQNNRRLWFG